MNQEENRSHFVTATLMPFFEITVGDFKLRCQTGTSTRMFHEPRLGVAAIADMAIPDSGIWDYGIRELDKRSGR
jgi:hypothetical protein